MRLLSLFALVAVLTVGLIGTASAKPLTVAVYGDAPYGTTPTDTAQTHATPAFIASINADPNVSLVLHVGDIHSGKQFCTQAYDQDDLRPVDQLQGSARLHAGRQRVDRLQQGRRRAAALYNPATGQIDYVLDAVSGNPVDYAKGDPIANLDAHPLDLLPHARPRAGRAASKQRALAGAVLTSTRAHPTDAKFVENVMWEQSRRAVRDHQPAGRLEQRQRRLVRARRRRRPAQQQEIAERAPAPTCAGSTRAFALAQADGVEGVVIVAQADMWDTEKGAGAPGRLRAVRAEHRLAHDRLRQAGADVQRRLARVPVGQPAVGARTALDFMHPGYDVPNFHRVVVHGSTFPLEWLKLTVDPNANAPHGPTAFGPFSWEREIQP